MSGKRVFQFLILLAATSLISGCCITPIDGDTDSTQTRYFSGFTANPSDVLSIQVIDTETSVWETIATVRPETDRAWLHWALDGTLVYRWSRQVRIPNRYWYNATLELSLDGAPMRPLTAICHVRIVDSTNGVVATYKQPLTEEELLYGNPVDLFIEKGSSIDYLDLNLLYD
ncbi:hypothetical protein N9Z58_00285 [bacterium]|nr:hypothetical protein [bacterium]